MMSQPPSRLKRFATYALMPLIILIGACIAFISLVASRPESPARPVDEKVWIVNTLSAELRTLSPKITLYGRIESPRSAELSAAVTAFVDQLHVDEGSRVSAGDPLITLDDRDAQLVVTQRRGELNNLSSQIRAEFTRHQSDREAIKIETTLLQLAENSVQRFDALKGRKLGSDAQLDEAKRNYQQQALAINNRKLAINDHDNRLSRLQAQQLQAQALLDAALLDLERTRIRAPFAGRIAHVSVAPGDRIRSGDKLLMIYSTGTLEVRAQIPSRHLNLVRQALIEKQTLKAVAHLEESPIELSLNRLSGEVGSGRAGVDALLRIESDAKHLELGRNLELELELTPVPNILALPPQALYGNNRIYRIIDDRLQAILVNRVGDADNDGHPRILVTSPEIQVGDQILTTQLPNAITGLKVRLTGN
jgi:multidrug efflux pump subunit AcrA (membrane-fusion protein)